MTTSFHLKSIYLFILCVPKIQTALQNNYVPGENDRQFERYDVVTTSNGTLST